MKKSWEDSSDYLKQILKDIDHTHPDLFLEGKSEYFETILKEGVDRNKNGDLDSILQYMSGAIHELKKNSIKTHLGILQRYFDLLITFPLFNLYLFAMVSFYNTFSERDVAYLLGSVILCLTGCMLYIFVNNLNNWVLIRSLRKHEVPSSHYLFKSIVNDFVKYIKPILACCLVWFLLVWLDN
jgi:hypothetical protein